MADLPPGIQSHLERRAAELGRRYDVNVARLLAVFVRCAHPWPDGRGYRLDPDPREFFEVLAPGQALDFLESADPRRLGRRVWLARYLALPTVHFLDGPRLSDALKVCGDYLAAQRDVLCQSGHPAPSSQELPVPFRGLGRWYPVRSRVLLDVDPLDEDVLVSPDMPPAPEAHYRTDLAPLFDPGLWERLAGGRDDTPLIRWVRDLLARREAREQTLRERAEVISPASRRPRLDPDLTLLDAVRIEHLRPRAFRLVERIVDELRAALQERAAGEIWPRCLAHLRSVLSSEDARFLLRLDGEIEDSFRSLGPDFGDFRIRFPQGLTSSVELIGVVEHALTRSSATRLLKAFDPLLTDRRGTPRLGMSYYQALADGQAGRLDDALRVFEELAPESQSFWMEFSGRAAEAIPGRLDREVVHTATLPEHRAEAYGASLEAIAPVVRAHVEGSGQVVRPQLVLQSAHALDEAGGAGPPFRFRQLDGSWDLSWEGTTVEIAAKLTGLEYIRELLRSPVGGLSALELFRRRNPLPAPSALDSDSAEELTREETLTASNEVSEGISMLTEDELGRYRKLQRELGPRIAVAQETGNSALLAALKEEERQLYEFLASQVSISGRPRKVGGDAEKARKAVSRAIGTALSRIDKVHPALHAHLKASLRLGVQMYYQPEQRPNWLTSG